jgi:hypothetical protein
MLNRRRSGRATVLQAFKEHPLVRRMLIDERHASGALGDNE